ncbi:adenylyltransferase/cytidyltransferase family protein [Rubellicoccus peritrichatus]|uniref:Adenylyltransferase/cytidyltransferase family protein n=1 Tax=Rubellicoccus peritrichatus TaxID=3080537 RepID=A0AAQ3QW14_9BACT|nr:adenylyltransferase/cytidyltransferase family protein [Puniceicoccus sp. CR14]WOO41460.1 adenylyltransferase/cytidyltransferase family protein [Puniceicoccus sp. CR14]
MKLSNPKLLSLEDAIAHRNALKAEGKSVVLTNGCFDLLHTGHIYYLRKAAALGDALFIAINGDASVQALKGPTRPVQNAEERAYLLGAIDFVDTLFVFHTPRLTAEIETIRPDIYAKAGDYTLDTLNPEERTALEACGADIQFLPFLEGYSTTSLIAKIAKAAETF